MNTLRNQLETDKPSANDSQNERHKEEQTTDYFDSDSAQKLDMPKRSTPLPTVLKACPGILDFCDGPITDWHSLIHQVGFLRTLIGINDDVWSDACREMGACDAAVIVACLFERLSEIKSPGAYLRTLTRKACEGELDVNATVISVLERREKRAA